MQNALIRILFIQMAIKLLLLIVVNNEFFFINYINAAICKSFYKQKTKLNAFGFLPIKCQAIWIMQSNANNWDNEQNEMGLLLANDMYMTEDGVFCLDLLKNCKSLKC